MSIKAGKKKNWFYTAVYGFLVLINLLPSYAQKPYTPQESQAVIIKLLQVSIDPYRPYGWIFHVATLLLIVMVFIFSEKMGRWIAGYMGLNYIIIALIQTMGQTQNYGFVLHTAAFATNIILGVTWLGVAWVDQLHAKFRKPNLFELFLLVLSLMAFWSPYSVSNEKVQPFFDPMLLLTSADYGLTFCFTTPVFLSGLILFYPHVNPFAYRLTAFSGFLYGLFNLAHFFEPNRIWMGFLHLPILATSIYALLLPRITGSNLQVYPPSGVLRATNRGRVK